LTISGGNWPEYFSNGVPFYSVLPNNPNYPYLGALGYDYVGPTIPDMQPEQLRNRIPELVEGAAFLLDPSTTYGDALSRHLLNIAQYRPCAHSARAHAVIVDPRSDPPKIAETGVVVHEREPHLVRGTVAVLGDDHLGRTAIGRVRVVDLVSVEEHHHVGVLLEGARFA
jgi:hypothetical protein